MRPATSAEPDSSRARKGEGDQAGHRAQDEQRAQRITLEAIGLAGGEAAKALRHACVECGNSRNKGRIGRRHAPARGRLGGGAGFRGVGMDAVVEQADSNADDGAIRVRDLARQSADLQHEDDGNQRKHQDVAVSPEEPLQSHRCSQKSWAVRLNRAVHGKGGLADASTP